MNKAQQLIDEVVSGKDVVEALSDFITNELKQLLDNPEVMIEWVKNKVGSDYDGPVGLRGLYEDEIIDGSVMDASHTWIDGEYTDEELNGTCALLIAKFIDTDSEQTIINNIKECNNLLDQYMWGGRKVGLLIGNGMEYGEDEQEVVIRNARCIYVWS